MQPVIQIDNLTNIISGKVIHEHLSLDIAQGEVVGIVGGSGSGKTTLLRSILMLLEPVAGAVKVFDTDVTDCSLDAANAVRERWGVLFQQNALFSSLTLLENVMFPLREFTDLSPGLQKELALLKISMAGLEVEAANKYPAELSGGMQKRGALARAIALDPELLFLDEPTAGLDPKSASDFDSLVLHLQKALNLTVVMVTHDLDTLWESTDRVAFLGDGRVLAYEPMAQLVQAEHPMIREYFSGPRGRLWRNHKK